MTWIEPDWPAPASVAALSTTRGGGTSGSPFDSFNLAAHVGDTASAVATNRARLQAACPGLGAISWLQQVHGARVVAADAAHDAEADAQYTDVQGLGCAILTADCLPVLICNQAGTAVAAAHAGWRGLASGVLEQTVASFTAPPTELLVWLGPAIGPQHFEVGDEVREAFLDVAPVIHQKATVEAFAATQRPHRWHADLYTLARMRLAAAGVSAVHGGGFCTFAGRDRFFSYRRDRITGRMATLIWLIPDADARW